MRVWWTPADGVKSKTALSVNFVVNTGVRAFAPDNIPAEKFAEKFMEKYLGIRGSDKEENMNSPQFEGIPIHISTKTAISASAFRHWLRIPRLPTLQDGMSWLGRQSEMALTAGRLRP